MLTWTDAMWLVTAAALVGTAANVRKKRWSFWIWAATNAVFAARNFWIREWPQACLFSVYLGLAVWGLRAWKKGDAVS